VDREPGTGDLSSRMIEAAQDKLDEARFFLRHLRRAAGSGGMALSCRSLRHDLNPGRAGLYETSRAGFPALDVLLKSAY
jgi:hypothetical protein